MTQDQWEMRVLELWIVAEMMRRTVERLKPDCKAPGDMDLLRHIEMNLEAIHRFIRKLETPFT